MLGPILVAMLLVSSALSDECFKVRCVQVGQRCHSTGTDSVTPDSIECNPLTTWTPCSADRECEDWYLPRTTKLCTSGVCHAAPGTVANGMPCAKGKDCITGTCTGGVCANPPRVPAGQRCLYSEVCAPGTRCYEDSCSEYIANHAACHGFEGELCMGSCEEECFQSYSRMKGERCSSSDSCDCDWVKGVRTCRTSDIKPLAFTKLLKAQNDCYMTDSDYERCQQYGIMLTELSTMVRYCPGLLTDSSFSSAHAVAVPTTAVLALAALLQQI
eukprot:m51a1_g5325 hypothetical protein (272) ;mRNA; r:367972-369239